MEAFVESKSFSACDRIKRNILSLYLVDIGKFGDYETAIDWLEDVHRANPCRRCTDPSVGPRMTE